MDPVWLQPLDHQDPAIAEAILAVQLPAYRQEALLLGASSFPPLKRAVDDIVASRECYLGAFDRQQLVGALSMGLDTQPGQLNIASLVVLPSHQRRGVGRRLMAAVLEGCAGTVVTVSTGADNAPALALYQSFGFVEFQRRAVGPDALVLVKMRRPASAAKASAGTPQPWPSDSATPTESP